MLDSWLALGVDYWGVLNVPDYQGKGAPVDIVQKRQWKDSQPGLPAGETGSRRPSQISAEVLGRAPRSPKTWVVGVQANLSGDHRSG